MNTFRAVILGVGLLATIGARTSAIAAREDLRYADVLAMYRAGEYDRAVKAVSALGASTVEEERRALERTPFGTLKDDEVRAAMMLHTEAYFDSASGQLPHLPSPHLDHARRLARRCLELLDPLRTATDSTASQRARDVLESINAREFVRQWYLLVVSQFQGVRHISRSAHYLQEARFLFPDDPDLLLASGSHHEMLTLVGSARVPLFNDKGGRIGEERIDVRKELSEALRYFRAALAAANPTLTEAHVRLGRTLYLTGDLDAAGRELDAARTRATHPNLQYLAAVFLALVEEDRGRPQRSAELYVEAMKIFPPGQASYVGLSELLYASGQPEEAAAMMNRLLERPAPRDPWWTYVMGEWWHFDARLAALRAQVRS